MSIRQIFSGRLSLHTLRRGVLYILAAAYPWLAVDDLVYQFATAVLLVSLLFQPLHRIISLRAIICCFPLVIFAVLGGISMMWSIMPQRSFVMSLHLLVLVWLVIFASEEWIRSRDAGSWLVTLSLISAWSVISQFLLIILKSGQLNIKNAVENDNNYNGLPIGNVGISILLLCLPILIEGWRKSRKLHILLCIVLMLFGLAVSGSRAGISLSALALIIQAGFSYFYFRKIHWLQKTINIVMLMSVTFLLVLPFVNNFSFNEIIKTQEERSAFLNGDPNSNSDDFRRYVMYAELLHIAEEYTYLGIGYEAFPDWSNSIYGKSIQSHALLLTAYGELGLAGVMAILIILIRAASGLRLMITSKDMLDKRMGIAIAVAVFIGFIHWMVRPQLSNVFFLVLLGISMSHKHFGSTLIRNPAFPTAANDFR